MFDLIWFHSFSWMKTHFMNNSQLNAEMAFSDAKWISQEFFLLQLINIVQWTMSSGFYGIVKMKFLRNAIYIKQRSNFHSLWREKILRQARLMERNYFLKEKCHIKSERRAFSLQYFKKKCDNNVREKSSFHVHFLTTNFFFHLIRLKTKTFRQLIIFIRSSNFHL